MPAFFLLTFCACKKRAFQQNADVTQRVRRPQSHQCSVGSELRLPLPLQGSVGSVELQPLQQPLLRPS